MIWKDKGIIISKQRYSESSLILKVFTKEHGFYSGYIKGAAKKTKKNSAKYEVGNLVYCEWYSRIEDALGSFKIEIIESNSGYFISNKIKLDLFNLIILLIKGTLHDREKHSELFEFVYYYLNKLKKANFQSLKEEETKYKFRYFIFLYIVIEFFLIQEQGYSLDLTECAVTGSIKDLIYLSPKTGRAVCKEIGEPYRNKILKLPQFLTKICLYEFDELISFFEDESFIAEINNLDLIDGMRLTDYFVIKWLFYNKLLLDNFKEITERLSSFL